jgi:hypothetical protein
MISQLGLEPGAHLRALHQHILADAGAVKPIAVPRRPARPSGKEPPGSAGPGGDPQAPAVPQVTPRGSRSA